MSRPEKGRGRDGSSRDREPWLALRVLRRLLPADDVDAVSGDLLEVWRRRRAAGSRQWAGLWLWSQVIGAPLKVRLGRARGLDDDRGLAGALTRLRDDLLYAVRSLRSAPAFFATATLVLALGIGATTAIFSYVDGVLIEPLEWPDADHIVAVDHRHPRFGGGKMSIEAPVGRLFAEESSLGRDLTGWHFARVDLVIDSVPTEVPAALLLPGTLEMFGADLALGRSFAPEEHRDDAAVVVLAHELWASRLGGDPGFVGSTLEIDGRAREVIGVLAEGSRLPQTDAGVFMPTDMAPTAEGEPTQFFSFFARVDRPADVPRLRAQLQGLQESYEERNPGIQGWQVNVEPLREQIVGHVRPALLTLFGAVAAVLLIACANIAGLLTARGAQRESDLAIRMTLGATGGRIVRQLLLESLLLALVAGGVGVLLSAWATRALVALTPASVPRLANVGPSPRVMLFALATSLLTGLLFGAAPALRIAGGRLGSALGRHTRGASGDAADRRLRAALTVGEVALALVLLVGAGLLLRSVVSLVQVDPGFRTDGRATMQVKLPEYAYPDRETRLATLRRIDERLESLPGVRSVAATSWVPLSGVWGRRTISVEDVPQEDEEQHWIIYKSVSPGFFRTLGVPVRAGRGFTATDDADAPPVAVINESMARRFWPGDEPLGRRFKLGGPEDEAEWIEVVGLVPDLRQIGLDDEIEPAAFFPYAQLGLGPYSHLVIAGDDLPSLADAVRGAVREIAPDAPLTDLRPLADVREQHVMTPRFYAVLLGGFAATAALLAAVGLYGVIAFGVTRRTREIGVRMALGAGRRSVLGLVLREGMSLVVAGLALGLGLSLLLTRLLESMLFSVGPSDPATLVAVVLGLGLVGLAATLLPARRATRIDPATALASE